MTTAGFDGRVLIKHGVDLAELDSITADLDLIIGAAKKFEVAVRTATREIAGAITTARETVGRQIGAIAITSRDSGASKKNFASHPIGDFAPLLVAQMNLHIVDRSADRWKAASTGAITPDVATTVPSVGP